MSAETAFYNETEIDVHITKGEELINETVIVPAQVAPTGMYLESLSRMCLTLILMVFDFY